VNALARRYPIDRSRIYVAGISAGGAMTAILALCYGALFAACAIVAGMMYGAAESALTGARAMRHGASVLPERLAEEAARRASRKASFVPALVIHGSADSVVHPLNAEQIVRNYADSPMCWARLPSPGGMPGNCASTVRHAAIVSATTCAAISC